MYQAASESDLDANNTGDEGSAWAVSSNDLPSQVPPSSMVGVVPSMVGLVRSMMGVVPRMGVVRGGGTWHSGGGTYVFTWQLRECCRSVILVVYIYLYTSQVADVPEETHRFRHVGSWSKAYKEVVDEWKRLHMRDPEPSALLCMEAHVKLRKTRLKLFCDWCMRVCAKKMPFAQVTYQKVGPDIFCRDERPSELVHALKHQDILAGTVDAAHDKLCTGGKCVPCKKILHAYSDLVEKAVQNARMNKGVRETRDRRMEDGVRRQFLFDDGLFLVLEFKSNNLSRRQGYVVTLYSKTHSSHTCP